MPSSRQPLSQSTASKKENRTREASRRANVMLPFNRPSAHYSEPPLPNRYEVISVGEGFNFNLEVFSPSLDEEARARAVAALQGTKLTVDLDGVMYPVALAGELIHMPRIPGRNVGKGDGGSVCLLTEPLKRSDEWRRDAQQRAIENLKEELGSTCYFDASGLNDEKKKSVEVCINDGVSSYNAAKGSSILRRNVTSLGTAAEDDRPQFPSMFSTAAEVWYTGGDLCTTGNGADRQYETRITFACPRTGREGIVIDGVQQWDVRVLTDLCRCEVLLFTRALCEFEEEVERMTVVPVLCS